MKPITLTMRSFGSYGKKTVIDFTKPNQNLFLITGDTGSGKTTIFDAMVFALYGDVSSSDSVREGAEIQSHYADTNVKPFVELVFSESIDGEDRVFTVNRIPQHYETKKRGAGVTKKGEEVSLILSDGMEFTANLRDTNEKITEITGFTKDQFMQVGMIAQGEFMKVLRENTSSKKQIFSKLFNTQIYQKITEELKERCKEKNADIDRIKIQYRQITGQIEIPEDYSDAELMTDIKSRVLSSDNINSFDIDLLTEKLSLMCSDTETKMKAAETVLNKEEKNREQFIEKLSAASAVSESFKHLKEAEENLKKYAAEKDNIDKLKVLAADIEKSYDIKIRYDACEEAEKALADLKKRLTESESTLQENTDKKKAAESEEEKGKKNLDKVKAELSRISERVEKANEKFGKTEALSATLSKKEAEISRAKKKLESSEKAHKELQEKIENGKKHLEKLYGADKTFEILQMKLNSFNSLEKDINNITDLRNKTAEIRRDAEKLQKDYIKSDTEYNSLNAEYSAKRKIYFDSQAGLLAKELKENTPCPVCGSLSHPLPCLLPEDIGNITLDELNKIEKKARTAGDKAAKLSESISGLNGRITESEKNIEQNIESLRAGLSEYICNLPEKMTLENITDIYSKFRSELKNECSAAEENAVNLEKLNTEMKNDSELFEKQTVIIGESKENLSILSNDLTKISTELQQIKSDLDFKSKAEADAVLNKAEADKEEAENYYAVIRKHLDNAQSVYTRNVTMISQYKKDIPVYSETVKRKKEEYHESVSAGRISEEKWKEIVSAYPKSDKDVFYKKINAYNLAVTAAEKAKENAEKIIKGQPEPDVEKIKNQKTESESKCLELRSDFDRLRECHKTDKKVLGELVPLKERSMDTVAKYTVLKSLYDRLSGNVTNSRMDLETFVQRYYLQRILDSANRRFSSMSAGQYELRMFDEESAGRGSNKGLDLKVYSTVTGKEREVGTLSGGESFMAALSLALGMSDQIQENTSAVNLDVMFIDEGFGSLDDHSRNQAVRVLQQMAGSSKLIGIISHVTELKQEIDNHLEVTKDNEGSHAKWVIS